MKRLQLPLSLSDRLSLHTGEQVLLSGVLYTARDAAHKRMKELLDQGKPLPFDLKGQTIYYVGPTQTPPGMIFGSAGPTTSTRMDVYTPQLLDLGLAAMIGKGRRSPQVKEAMLRNQAVYFAAVGGAGALLGLRVKEAQTIAFEDLQSEAIRRLVVEEFPVFVCFVCQGVDLYDEDFQ